MLQGLDADDRALGLLGGLDGAHLQHIGVLLEQIVGHIGDGGLGGGGLTAVLHAQSQHHLALPQGNGVDQRGLDLLQHEGVVVLDQTGLGAHLDGDHAGELQIVDLLLKAVAQVGVVVVSLGILLSAGLGGLLAQFLEGDGASLLQSLLAGQDIHGQFLVVFGVQLIHLVQHGDVLHQGDLMALQNAHDLVHVDLGLGVGDLDGFQLVALLLEEAEEALLLLLTEALQLHYQRGESVADLAQILGADIVQGILGETGDVLLSGGTVLEDLSGVGDVDLLGEVGNHLALGLGEVALVQLDGVLVALGLGSGLSGGRIFGGGGGLQSQNGSFGSLCHGGGGFGSQGQLGHGVFIHDRFLLSIISFSCNWRTAAS